MFEKKEEPIYIDTLRKPSANSDWFSEESPCGLAGRCLLDAMEYLHSVQKLPGRFWHVVNAHAVRLVHRCLTDEHVNRPEVLSRMTRHIDETCKQLSASRQDSVPHFGDDFWDWASVINAFAEVKDISETAKSIYREQLSRFFDEVQSRVRGSLSIGDPDREWYGPATAALAHRILDKLLDSNAPGRDEVLAWLKKLALTTIENGKYFGCEVPSRQIPWHYGQVVAIFPKAKKQAQKLADLSWLQERLERPERVYALARVLQGAYRINQTKTKTQALHDLYRCQNLKRPLGHGLIGDNVKGSLNVLDAIWPNLVASDKIRVAQMIDALINQYAKANTIGFQVAVPNEAATLEAKLKENGAEIGSEVNGAKQVTHRKFYGVIRQGKSNTAATSACQTLIEGDKAKWIIMSGIAGSLGTTTRTDADKTEFVGPTEGDVVVAASLVPFRIRQKAREGIENAPVPFDGHTWMIIPADPQLFRLAHLAAQESHGDFKRFYEGQVVTGTGILDDPTKSTKAEILKEFPGGLATEEEGYQMGVVCLSRGIPCLNIRAISDLAEGGKRAQSGDKAREAWEQRNAGRAAAALAVKVALALSEQW